MFLLLFFSAIFISESRAEFHTWTCPHPTSAENIRIGMTKNKQSVNTLHLICKEKRPAKTVDLGISCPKKSSPEYTKIKAQRMIRVECFRTQTKVEKVYDFEIIDNGVRLRSTNEGTPARTNDTNSAGNSVSAS